MSDAITILIVEDDIQLLNSNRLALETEGYCVLAAECLREAQALMAQEDPDLVVLDIMLPDGSGLDFLQELRKSSSVPVLLLTALDKSIDVMKGLETGADDYLTKPFDVGVFRTRIKALLRRASQVPETITRGALRLDIASGQAFLSDTDLLLTQKEFSLLLLFVQNEGRTLKPEELYEKVWKQPMLGDSQSLRTIASRLRIKLEGSGFDIETLYKEGYRFLAVNK